MSRGRKANPAVIGAFVLGAIVLAVVAVTVFGSGKFFRQTVKLVCYFSGSVNGLNKGAPVKFRGVQIGSVTDILLQFQQQMDQIRIPVWIEIDQTRVSQLGGNIVVMDRGRLDELIARGLRAKLETESFVTGVLYVGLDLTPESPEVLVLSKDSGILEIPTLPTTLEQAFQTFSQVMHRVQQLDIEGLVTAIRTAFDGVNQVARSPDLERSLASLSETLASIRRLSQSLEPRIGPVMKDLQLATAQARTSLQSIDATLTQVQSLVDPRAPLAVELTHTIVQLGAAAQSVSNLAEYLDRNPSAILTGRPAP